MTWHYQIIKDKYEGTDIDCFGIKEVYLNKDRKIFACTKEWDFGPYESVKELMDDLNRMWNDGDKYGVITEEKLEEEIKLAEKPW